MGWLTGPTQHSVSPVQQMSSNHVFAWITEAETIKRQTRTMLDFMLPAKVCDHRLGLWPRLFAGSVCDESAALGDICGNESYFFLYLLLLHRVVFMKTLHVHCFAVVLAGFTSDC